MYSVERASRGASVRAKFKWASDSDYTPAFGVGVNYYRETRAEAAERLSIEKEDVVESDYGHNAIVAVYEGDDDKIHLYRVKDSQDSVEDSPATWTEITASGALSWAAATYYWISLLFQDGYCRVLTRPAASGAWTEQISTVFAEDSEPWFRPNNDYTGRGILFIRNKTPFSRTPGFDSQSMLIPVESTDAFPASGTVIVGNEQITYDGKATNANVPGELTVIEGDTFDESPCLNTNWADVIIREQEWNEEAAGEANLGKDHTSEIVYLASSISCWYKGQPWKPYNPGNHYGDMEPAFRVDKIRIPIKKIGTPTTDLYCYMVWDNWDNDSPPPWAAFKMSSAAVSAGSVGTSFGYIDFDFTGESEPDRWLDDDPGPGKAPKYAHKAWFVCVTTMPPNNRSWGNHHDPDNYYVVKMNNSLDDKAGLLRIWSVEYAWKTWRERWTNTLLPYQVR
ncbi:unnamed protein product, partial [marine sediment metagenome]